MTKKIIVGNWKMNPVSRQEARDIVSGVKKNSVGLKKTSLVICPPVVYLEGLVARSGGKILFGVQDIFWEESGARTGSISPAMVREAGAAYVIIGHSERRAAGENGEMINQKIKTAIKAGLEVILCVGEKERDQHGKYLGVLEAQLKEALDKIPSRLADKIIIAYEPVWAIGKNATGVETPEGFRHNAIYIKKVLSGLVGKKRAMEIPVLYGGSADAKNAASFLGEGQADGLLVGRASLNPRDFGEILRQAESLK